MKPRMTQQESEYDRWVRLANDPAQSEETRRECRVKMKAHFKERIRQEFEKLVQAHSRSHPHDDP